MNLEEVKKELGNLCGYVYIKLSDNDEFPLEHIRIGNKKYSDKNDIPRIIAEYSINVKKAIEMVREYESFEDIGQHIDPFIIKYHPTWMRLRKEFGFIYKSRDEILCERDDSEDTIKDYIKDTFLAMGINVDHIRNNNSLPLNEKIELLFSKESIDKHVSQDEINHPDFVAFKNAAIAKEMFCKNISNINYMLKDGFPLMTIDNKFYDFRKKEDYDNFYKEIESIDLKDKEHQRRETRKTRQKQKKYWYKYW